MSERPDMGQPAVATEGPTPNANIKLLVVDDTEANRYSIVRHLRRSAFQVDEAATGGEALERATSGLPDLIILDIRLPDISGLEVSRRLRADERTADIPILHISASFTDPESRARGLDNGADAYLTHPVDPPVMLATVRALVRARKAERDARTAARQWRVTFDAIAEGVCVVDHAGRVLRSNRAFRDITGLTGEDAVPGPAIAELLPGLEVNEQAPFVHPPGGGPVGRIEIGDRWLRVAVVATAGDGGAAEAVCVISDLTRERRIDERMRQVLQLESTGRLAGGVAHEINNMMTAILAYADFALRALPAGDPIREDIEGIHHAATRSSDVARQLLTFSRRQVIQPRVIDLHAQLRTIRPMIARLLGADRSFELELHASDPWVAVDPAGLDQILVNLALNARDAMEAGGALVVRTSDAHLDAAYAERFPGIVIRHGEYVQIAMRDTGVGMTAATLERVFEPFFTTKDVGKGTGLGLATVFGMVKQSDGYIWAESEPGAGATFTVQLPRVPAPEGAVPAAPASRTEPASGTVLLVEDEPVVLQLLSRSLRAAGYAVMEARNGVAALEVLEARGGPGGGAGGGIIAMVTDIVMPEMNGRDLARVVRERWPELPILFMSGCTSDEIVSRGLLAPGEAFLQKPFDMGVLTESIRGLLAGAVR